MTDKHVCNVEAAPILLGWIRTREGIAVWRTVNLSNPGESWSAPVINAQGQRLARPHSYAASEPERIITSTDDVLVQTEKVVKRFHVGLEQHAMGLKLTAAATRRVRREVDKASVNYQCKAWYRFEFDTQDALICVPASSQTLTEFAKENNL